MNWLIYGIVLVIWVVVAIVMIILYRQYLADARNLESESQRLMWQIKREAEKKNVNADSMIVNALKRVLDNIKSL